MTQTNDQAQPEENNIHAAASAEHCQKIADKERWELIEVRPNGDRILPVNCIFKGEQVSFQDQWFDHQD